LKNNVSTFKTVQLVFRFRQRKV